MCGYQVNIASVMIDGCLTIKTICIGVIESESSLVLNKYSTTLLSCNSDYSNTIYVARAQHIISKLYIR
jgi:hypothetical protein